jgi:hypothetical protein
MDRANRMYPRLLLGVEGNCCAQRETYRYDPFRRKGVAEPTAPERVRLLSSPSRAGTTLADAYFLGGLLLALTSARKSATSFAEFF